MSHAPTDPIALWQQFAAHMTAAQAFRAEHQRVEEEDPNNFDAADDLMDKVCREQDAALALWPQMQERRIANVIETYLRAEFAERL